MFAAQYHRFGPPEVLVTGSYEEPHAGPGQVRIRVAAAGIAPVDLAIRAGLSRGQISLPHVPGVDAAGIIDEIGPGVSGYAVGDEVFGTVDLKRLGGASAEFAVLGFWASKPGKLPWVQAGAAGTSIETATRALDLLDVGAGTTLLIDGAAGGVGSVAVQLAAARGARVVGTGRPGSQDFIAGLGATPVVAGPDLVGRAVELGVSAVLDVAGAGRLAALTTITDAVLTIADFSAAEHGVRMSVGALGGEPDGQHGLQIAAALVEQGQGQGRFRVPVQEVFALEDMAAAHAAAGSGHRRGKIAVWTGLVDSQDD
ncbi:NADP-dependent oxidoreductase [Actinoplanes friuliensis]|nr:NADP-dependent oxidoreductase [Actinoplanes friuliensis]